MYVIHFKNIISRSEEHLLAACQNHCLKHVDHLCDVGHLDTAGVLVEDVERRRSHEGIAHCTLLEEVTRVGARFYFPPSAPFVNEKTDLVFRVESIHDLTVVLDALVDLDGTAQSLVILLLSEVSSLALVIPVAH